MDAMYQRVQEKYPPLGNFAMRDKQMETLQHFMDDKDTVCQLPTGYGKSLIYILFALLSEEVGFTHTHYIKNKLDTLPLA